MFKGVNVEDMYSWLKIMATPEVIDAERGFWRLSGALSILAYLDVISFDEKNKMEDEYIQKYIAETGA